MNGGDEPNEGSTEPIQLPIDGVLDLHTFRPSDVKSVVTDYLAECRARAILRVRIIHGKGIGNLRRTVHATLSQHPDVISFALASPACEGACASPAWWNSSRGDE